MNRLICLICLTVAVAIGLLARDVSAAPPTTLNYQGALTNSGGTPVNGTLSMTLRLYAAATGGVPLYAETQSVTVTNGNFNVQLGAVSPLSLPFDVPYFLGVTVGTDAEMTPRQPLASSGYAFRAVNADAALSLLGQSGANIVRAESNATLFVGENAGPAAGIGGGNNTAAGSGALSGLTTGSSNSAFGTNSLLANTQGVHNTAVGFLALNANTIGGNNIGVGGGALLTNIGGGRNVALGYLALGDNLSGNDNTALGNAALDSNTTGLRNIGIGATAGGNLTTGNDNIAIGHPGVAAESATTRIGSAQTRAFIAGVRGVSPPGGSPLPVVIDAAGQLGTGLAGGSAPLPSGGDDYQVLIGPGSAPAWSGSPTLSNLTLVSNLTLTQASRVLLEGVNSFMHVSGGPTNTFIGADAGNYAQTGTGNAAVGRLALASISSASSNTAMGSGALRFATTGGLNTAVGADALRSNSIGTANTATGVQALRTNSSGIDNVANGYFALFSSTTGNSNTAVGRNAAYSNTTGDDNTAVGRDALYNGTGSSNTAFGRNAAFGTTTGINNTALGRDALYNTSTGSGNIAIGRDAGFNLTTGSDNIAIGNGGVAAESATTRIGSAQTRAFIAGIRGVTTGSATGIPVLIDSNGQLGTVSSSGRVKQEISDMAEASSVLAQLRPVTFRYKAHDGGPLQFGLIAEEVAAVASELVARKSDGSIETVYYQHLPPMLLNEWQKQQRTIDTQAARIDSLERDIAMLKDLVMRSAR